MDNKRKLLIIDEFPELHQLLYVDLENHFSCTVTHSADSIMKTLNVTKPHAVLIDQDLESTDSLDLCRQIRTIEAFHYVPLVYMASEDSHELRIACAQAGVDNLVIKPGDGEEIWLQIVHFLEYQQHHEHDIMNIKRRARWDHRLGRLVVDFLETCFRIDSFDELADALSQRLNTLDIDYVMRLSPRFEVNLLRSSDSNRVRQTDMALIDELMLGDYLYSDGHIDFFNFGGISLLVKNLVQFGDDANILREHLTTLMQVCESNIMVLKVHHKQRETGKKVQSMIRLIESEIDLIERDVERRDGDVTSLIGTVLTDMSTLIQHEKLNETQEKALLLIIERCMLKLVTLFSDGTQIERSLQQVLEQLRVID